MNITMLPTLPMLGETGVTVKKGRKIWVTTQFHGTHRYPDAPEEVSYLRVVHRHLFKVKATVEVLHDDREVEFHMLQNFIKSLYSQGTLDVNNKSCEMLASDLVKILSNKYGSSRQYEVEVSEDGECGAIVSESRILV